MYVGVDGCKSGWFYLSQDESAYSFGTVRDLRDLTELFGFESRVFVDVPIGLKESGEEERLCDLEARKLLGSPRGSSVFRVPCRQAVYADNYEEASRLNELHTGKKLSKQAWGIVPKIRETDELLCSVPQARNCFREVHPEVCFRGLMGNSAQYNKKTAEGAEERLRVLQHHGDPYLLETVSRAQSRFRPSSVGQDDILDAAVALICAMREKECVTLPATPEIDPKGIRMEISFLRAK